MPPRKKVKQYQFVWENRHLKTGYITASSLELAEKHVSKRKTDSRIIGFVDNNGYYIAIKARRKK